jgi:hypothetical protein
MTNILVLQQMSGSMSLVTNGDFNAALLFLQSDGVTPLDITGITFRSHIRPAPGSDSLILDMSTSNGLLLNGETSGILSWIIPRSRTRMLTVGAAVADLLAIADGHTINLVQASPMQVLITQGVTC